MNRPSAGVEMAKFDTGDRPAFRGPWRLARRRHPLTEPNKFTSPAVVFSVNFRPPESTSPLRIKLRSHRASTPMKMDGPRHADTPKEKQRRATGELPIASTNSEWRPSRPLKK